MNPPSDRRESDRRAQRRITVGLVLQVSGVEGFGAPFEDTVPAENVSRTGASFYSTRQVDLGDELEITIPGQATNDFQTRARIVRVLPGRTDDERLIGIQFLGRRFHRIFVSEGES